MYRFILFLKKISFVLLFIAIETVALRFFYNSSSYNQAKMINVTNFLVGDIYTGINSIKHYFSLARENRQLNGEVAALREELERYRGITDSLPGALIETGEIAYFYTTARINNNSIVKSENFFTIDKGMRDGVKTEMAVLSDGAVAGYIVNCSNKFSVGISILNTRFNTSGRLQDEEYFGPVFWDGLKIDEVVLSEIPKYAPIQVGDTILTTNHSYYFPPDIPIGTVRSFELINGTYYEARVKLFADMAALNHVVLVDYIDREEKMELEHETENRQIY